MGFYIDQLEKKINNQVNITVLKNAEMDIKNQKIKLSNLRNDDGDEDLVKIRVLCKGDKYDYICHVTINIKTASIIESKCGCSFRYKHNYSFNKACKHVIAAVLIYIEKVRKEEEEERIQYENMGINLINHIKSSYSSKESVKLEVFIDKYIGAGRYEISFKIGSKKMYVLKSIEDFVSSRLNNKDLQFGKGFTYSPLNQKFDYNDEKICRYIEEFMMSVLPLGYNREKLVKGKYIYLTGFGLRNFLSMVDGKEITLNDEKFKVIKDDIPVKFELNKNENMYILKFKEEQIKPLTSRYDVYLFGKSIYLPSKEQINMLVPVIKYIDKYGFVQFKDEDKAELFNNIIYPINSQGSSKVILDKNIDNIVAYELDAEFKLDYNKKKIILDVDLKYGNEILKFYNQSEESEKIIIRDTNKEQDILDKITELNFEYENKKFVFNGSEEDFFYFLKEDYKKLDALGTTYYSDQLKKRKVYLHPNITAGINSNDNNYFEFNFKIEDINPAEYKKILEAFNEKRKYYKLKDNSFIDLEDKQLNNFLGLVDSIDSKNTSGKIQISKNKAIVIYDYIEDKKLDFIKGKDVLEHVCNKLTDLENIKLKLPKELNAELRKYQVTGFRWFKNLSYLGFGGILADEMGLGKTVQTIAFLLSEKGKKTLIITPTSLIYNWKNEFKKFAHSMKVAVVHGNKNERDKILEDVSQYDVILTTYGTLKNDEENYKSLQFDYCILDEAQNIKNPLAQNTISVKNVNAGNKFVLTGTPMENNLVELWSIFDFIMPGYLGSIHNFKRRFVNKNDSVIELQKYIKPFMLRRLKKDVIKELPQKIEKNYYVELTKEQKKLYVSYVEKIKEEMESEDFKDDKITIFSYLTKLRQLCLDPSVIFDNYHDKNSKLEELISILYDYIENNHKILVFSQFTSVLKNISKRLAKEKINHMYLDGSIAASKRLEMVKEFNENKDISVFLISLKAGGTGLNLTSADIVIHFDPWWNPAVEEQATDRAHRIGQKNVVQVIKLISEGTIEDKIINMQEEKKKLINEVLDNGYTSENVLKSLSSDELKELFI